MKKSPIGKFPSVRQMIVESALRELNEWSSDIEWGFDREPDDFIDWLPGQDDVERAQYESPWSLKSGGENLDLNRAKRFTKNDEYRKVELKRRIEQKEEELDVLERKMDKLLTALSAHGVVRETYLFGQPPEWTRRKFSEQDLADFNQMPAWEKLDPGEIQSYMGSVEELERKKEEIEEEIEEFRVEMRELAGLEDEDVEDAKELRSKKWFIDRMPKGGKSDWTRQNEMEAGTYDDEDDDQ